MITQFILVLVYGKKKADWCFFIWTVRERRDREWKVTFFLSKKNLSIIVIICETTHYLKTFKSLRGKKKKESITDKLLALSQSLNRAHRLLLFCDAIAALANWFCERRTDITDVTSLLLLARFLFFSKTNRLTRMFRWNEICVTLNTKNLQSINDLHVYFYSPHLLYSFVFSVFSLLLFILIDNHAINARSLVECAIDM